MATVGELPADAGAASVCNIDSNVLKLLVTVNNFITAHHRRLTEHPSRWPISHELPSMVRKSAARELPTKFTHAPGSEATLTSGNAFVQTTAVSHARFSATALLSRAEGPKSYVARLEVVPRTQAAKHRRRNTASGNDARLEQLSTTQFPQYTHLSFHKCTTQFPPNVEG